MGILERFKLDGRVALVTAGSGPQFGSSLTEGLAEAGATVISASRSLERNEEFAAGLRERDLDVHAAQVDITDVDSIHALRDNLLANHGRLDVLVNSALARDGHGGCLRRTDPRDDRAVCRRGLHRIVHDLPGVSADNGRAGSRVDHQHLEHLRRGRQRSDHLPGHRYEAACHLHIREGRHDQLHPLPGQLLRQTGRPVQLHHPRGVISTTSPTRSSTSTTSGCRWGGCWTTRTSRERWCTWRRMRPSTSTATTCWSTADGRRCRTTQVHST
ncbi:MAG: hypothetical protein Ct9H300mP1_09790 [Planctomycetaceae bacterium]|nr:MAG: hypothetical protein Ct9H300mP1_09790 [Planctomycetaceae bacterium]